MFQLSILGIVNHNGETGEGGSIIRDLAMHFSNSQHMYKHGWAHQSAYNMPKFLIHNPFQDVRAILILVSRC